MMSKAAVVAAVAFAAPSSAVAPCRWFRAEADSPGPFSGSRCMSEVEHITFSSGICQLMTTFNFNDWTPEDCAAIPYNENGDRCVAHGKQCLTPEGAAMMDDEQMLDLKSVAATCGQESEKDACNLTDECIWVEGDFLEYKCMPKQPATDHAFCRQVGAEDDCNGATPPLFSDLVEEDMYIFDALVDNSEDQLLRGQGESKDEEKDQEGVDEEGEVPEDDEEVQDDQEDDENDQEKVQEGEDDQDELDHGVDVQDEDQEDDSRPNLSDAIFNMVKKHGKPTSDQDEDDQDELDHGIFDDIGSGNGVGSGTMDWDALAKNPGTTDLNDVLGDWDDVFGDSDDIDSVDTDIEVTDKDSIDTDIDLTDKDSTDTDKDIQDDIKKGLDDAIKNVKEKIEGSSEDDASAATHIAVSFLALSIAAVLLSL